ncbi:MAG: hypothetical protein ABI972_26775 [Acidobacteriota bacterium]
MPRKRKAARAYRRPSSGPRARVEAVFKNEFAWLATYDLAEFARLLPEADERRAFSELWPEAFYRLHGFETGVCGYDEPFTRVGFVLTFLAEHPPAAPFDAPYLGDMGYGEARAASLAARAAWWKLNSWPMTPDERAWKPPGVQKATKVLTLNLKGTT